jgi:hypothetical protein
MPLGILFASSSIFDLSTRQTYFNVGSGIVLPGLYYFVISLLRPDSRLLTQEEKQKIS